MLLVITHSIAPVNLTRLQKLNFIKYFSVLFILTFHENFESNKIVTCYNENARVTLKSYIKSNK